MEEGERQRHKQSQTGGEEIPPGENVPVGIACRTPGVPSGGRSGAGTLQHDEAGEAFWGEADYD